MSTELEKIEEELRSQMYTALVELSFAQAQHKAVIVERLSTACRKLHDLVICGKIPEM